MDERERDDMEVIDRVLAAEDLREKLRRASEGDAFTEVRRRLLEAGVRQRNRRQEERINRLVQAIRDGRVVTLDNVDEGPCSEDPE